jgi:hypothetical protein
MENTYKLYNQIEFNSVKKNSPLPKGWEKRLSDKGQNFYVFKRDGRFVYAQLNKPVNYEKQFY